MRYKSTEAASIVIFMYSTCILQVALLALDIIEVALGLSGDLMAPYLLENCTALMLQFIPGSIQLSVHINHNYRPG